MGAGRLMQVPLQWQELGETQWQMVLQVFSKTLPNGSSVTTVALAAAVRYGQRTFDLKEQTPSPESESGNEIVLL